MFRIKHLIVTVSLVLALFGAMPVYADDPCTTSYGQPTVCGVKKEEVIVSAGLFDVNPIILGFSALSVASVMLVIASRKSPSSN